MVRPPQVRHAARGLNRRATERMEQLFDHFANLTSRFPVQIHRFDIAGRTLDITAPKDPDSLLDDPETEQRYKKDNYLPYWPVIWPSSLMLAHRIAVSGDSPPALPAAAAERPRVLELGCGLGIAGVVAGWRGWHVTFTDYDREAVEFARFNAIRNGLAVDAVAMFEMDWRNPVDAEFDWIIASDVLYERRLHSILLDAIDHLLAPQGVVWISDPQRNSASDFPPVAVERGFRIAHCMLKWTGPSGVNSDADLLILSRINKSAAVQKVVIQ